MSRETEDKYERLFKASPAKILVIRPASYEIVGVTDAYSRTTMTREADLLGKTLFEMFPDNPEEQNADGAGNLTRSLERVVALKVPDIMGVQRYPIRLPDGSFEERFWSAVNSPVLDDTGEVEFILHRVEDVTSIIRDTDAPTIQDNAAGGRSDPILVQDIALRSMELSQALSKLQEQESRMRSAERMLKLGMWEFAPETGNLNWSQAVFDIYDVPIDQAAPDLDGYFELVHPDDRERSRAVYAAFAEQRAPFIEFDHRVVARDGGIRHIRGVGKRHSSPDGEIVVGYVQDITELVAMRHKLSQAEDLLRLAGEKARLGGWRVELDSETVIWTSETAAIHGLPADYSPSDVSEAIGFYAPEYREVIQQAFERCVRDGEAFDVVCRLQIADGQHNPGCGPLALRNGIVRAASTLFRARFRTSRPCARRRQEPRKRSGSVLMFWKASATPFLPWMTAGTSHT